MLEIIRDPTVMWQLWVGQIFHLRPCDMIDLTVSKFIDMHDAYRSG